MQLQLLSTLLLLVAFTWAALRFMRRRPPCNEDLQVVARAGLTQRAGLALVSLAGRRILVGYGEGSPSLLLELDRQDAAAELFDQSKEKGRLPEPPPRISAGIPRRPNDEQPASKESVQCH